jgi:uncharacterized membrane protein YkoI
MLPMSSLAEKKNLIPVLLSAAVFAVASLHAAVTPPAFAQILASPGEDMQAASPQITGSINAKQFAKDFLNENLNATFVDAADIAENQVANGTVISGSLGVVQGYLVYNTTVANIDNNTAYRVFIDPSNGSVLATSQGMPLGTVGGQGGKEFLSSGNATATLVDAADMAEGQFANGTAIAGSFEVMEGRPVYSITVVEVNNEMLFHVVVDPSTGNVLATSEGTRVGNLGIKGVF